MDENQLKWLCIQHIHTAPYFNTICAVDTLPNNILEKPCFLICNSDMSYQVGSHWLLIMLQEGDMYPIWFDSLGKTPSEYNLTFEEFLFNHGAKYIRNSFKYQSPTSDKCGQFCLYIADLLCRDISFPMSLNIFNKSDLSKNDNIVNYFFEHHFLSI